MILEMFSRKKIGKKIDKKIGKKMAKRRFPLPIFGENISKSVAYVHWSKNFKI
jgi:hypothetical protein